MKKIVFSVLVFLGLVSTSYAGPATPAYDWYVWEVGSNGSDGQLIIDDVRNTSRTQNDHNGVIHINVIVMGGTAHTAGGFFNGSAAKVIGRRTYDLNGDRIVDAWQTFYEINTNSSGTFTVKDYGSPGGWQVKDSVFIK
ncbi:MAG: hypothetical protein OIF32_05435 [Campylobacterales bacterium]|nr:hypothetical protein [Campylobacterales bacterium]